jgi:hypothetical protein
MFSINAFAQDRPSAFGIQSSQFRVENSPEKMGIRNLKSIPNYSEKSSERFERFQKMMLNSLIQIYDSIYWWEWDNASISWKMTSKYSNLVYDSKNNLITGIGQEWDGIAWIKSDKDSYVYDSNNNPIDYLWQIWNETEWENSQKGILTYDQNNNLKSELVQEWNGSVWENSMLISRNYDVFNNETRYSHQNWNGTEWEYAWQHLYTYDTNNNLTSDLRQAWNGSAWEYSWENSYTYDKNNNLMGESYQVHNGAEWTYTEVTYNYDSNNKLISKTGHSYSNNWDYYTQGTYFYDSRGNLTIMLMQSVHGDTLENVSRSIITYDSNNNQISQSREDWKNDSWIILDIDQHSYDVNNFIKSDAYKYWDSSGTEIMEGDSTYYYFHTLTSINSNLDNIEGQIKIYPNPASEFVEISAKEEILSFRLYNIYGQLQLNQNTYKSQNRRIAVNMLPSGIYFAEIKTKTGMYKQKLIIH